MNINNHKLSNPLPSQANSKTHQTEPHDKSIFGSRVNRFVFNPKDTPGPGAYDFTVKEKHTQDFRVVKEKEQFIAPQHQWIFSSGRFSIPNSNAYVGPGLYNSDKGESMDLSHSNWPKRQRFNQTIRFKNPLGPGQYNEQSHKNSKYSNLAVFKSKSPRTFFEELAMKEKKLLKKLNPQEENEKEQVVKFQETTYPIRKKVEKLSSVFLSKCERPQLKNQQSSQKLGPGSYSVNSMKLPSQNSQKSNTAILSAIHYNASPRNRQKKAITLLSKITPPGPGSYQAQCNLQGVKKPLGIIAREERFKVNNQTAIKQKLPGPGQYMQKRYTMINQDQILFKNKRKSQKVHDFGTAARTTLRNKNQAPFGQYNVQLFDMNYKLLKQKEHYEKLRMMEVTLPAFNSKKHE